MHTKVIQIGDRKIGGGNPIAIQSMTNTKTEDVKATVEQILRLEKAGCEIIRCTVPTLEAAAAIREIKKQIHIPLVADIHFDYRMALAASWMPLLPAICRTCWKCHIVRKSSEQENRRKRNIPIVLPEIPVWLGMSSAITALMNR